MMTVIGNITERMLRQETISSLKLLRRMINTSIKWKENHQEAEGREPTRPYEDIAKEVGLREEAEG